MAELKKKHAWKTEGSGATFMGAHNPMAHYSSENVNSGGYNILTEGESIDDNPCCSKVDKNVIYYDSAGIALNTSGEFGGIGTKSILKLDVSSGELEEIISIKKYDCFKPVEDIEGNLYFIKFISIYSVWNSLL